MGVTTTWAIPFPANTDPWCLGDQYTANIATRIDALLDGLDTDIDRISMPPYASLETNTRQVTPTGTSLISPIVYTQVNADNGDYTNLTNDPTSIVVGTPVQSGRYIVCVYTSASSPEAIATNAFTTQIIANGDSNPNTASTNPGSFVPNGSSGVNMGPTIITYNEVTQCFEVDSTMGSQTLQGQISYGTSAGKDVFNQARMYFFWIGDV